MGWDPCDDRWWPEIAAALPLPWPREAVMMDLRWWASRVRRGVERRPGHAALERRWGWSEWQARQALKAEREWGDPAFPTVALPSPSRPPTVALPDSNENPALERVAPPVALPSPSRPPTVALATRVGDHSTQTQTQTPLPPPDLRNPGPPGDLPGKAGDRFYVAIWLDAVRAVGLLSHDVRLSAREQADAGRIAREVGGDRERIERTASWVLRSGAFEAKRAREQVAKGSLRWLLGDWPEIDRLAHANGHAVKPPRRETPDEIEARLAREAGDA